MIAMLIPLLLAVTPATFFGTGNDLQTCNQISGPDEERICLAYTKGVLDGVLLYAKTALCIPQGVTLSQILDIVKLELRDHPESRHYTAASLVVVALAKAFPCPKK